MYFLNFALDLKSNFNLWKHVLYFFLICIVRKDLAPEEVEISSSEWTVWFHIFCNWWQNVRLMFTLTWFFTVENLLLPVIYMIPNYFRLLWSYDTSAFLSWRNPPMAYDLEGLFFLLGQLHWNYIIPSPQRAPPQHMDVCTPGPNQAFVSFCFAVMFRKFKFIQYG